MPKSRLLFHVARTKKLQENCTIRMGKKKKNQKTKNVWKMLRLYGLYFGTPQQIWPTCAYI